MKSESKKKPIPTTPTPADFIPMREVLLLIGIKSRQTVYSRLRSDPTFPKPRRTAQYSIAWVRGEVDAWMASQPVAKFDGLGAIKSEKVSQLLGNKVSTKPREKVIKTPLVAVMSNSAMDLFAHYRALVSKISSGEPL